MNTIKQSIMLCRTFLETEAVNIAFVARYAFQAVYRRRYSLLWLVRAAACFGAVVAALNY